MLGTMKNEGEKSKAILSRRNAGIAVIEALGMVAFTTSYDHREKTHRSLKAKPLMNIVSRAVATCLGRAPRYWARTHISHHGARDANLLNILETADCLEWIDKQENKPQIPEVFFGLDPVAHLSADEVRSIGVAVRTEVKDRYDTPAEYSEEDLKRLLDGETPRYFYPAKEERSAEKLIRSGYRGIERLRSVLVDPHSPALHKNGVLGILVDNVPLFRANQSDVKAFEEIGEYDLGKDKLDERFFDSKLGLAAFFIANIAIQASLNKDRSIKGLAKSVIGGISVAAAVGQIYKLGGDITNGLGHLGSSFYRALADGKPQVKPDGTFSYNAKLFNLLTLDEVGGQYDHHLKPGKVAYTEHTGIKKIINAPFGSLLDALAERNILFERGDQYGHPELVDDILTLDSDREFVRPDEPMKAVLMLEAARQRAIGTV